MAQGSDNPVSVALSDTTMAWAGATGPYLSSGLYMSTTLSWSPIAKQSPDVHVTSVPTPPFNAGMTDLDVAGDFIATTGCTTRQDFTGTQCRVAVLQRSTKALFVLKPPDGVEWTLIAVTPNEVLLGEQAPTDQLMESFVRIRTDSLGAWNAPMPTP